MRDLPGFYFDTARQRYFPESSRSRSAALAASPAQSTHTPESEPRLPHPVQRNRTPLSNSLNASIVQVQRSRSQRERDTAQHSVMSQQIASTSSSLPVHVPVVYDAPITSLCISQVAQERPEGQARRTMSLGDRLGFCYADINDAIFAEHHLFSEITSIQAFGDVVVYTSFGPSPRILIRNVFSQEACILRPSYLHDVRASQIHGRSLTIGMQNKALHIFDLDNPRPVRSFITHSDVFALHRDINDVWTGTRNGDVRLFDIRTGQDQNVLGDRSTTTTNLKHRHASVTHLQRIREYQLLVAATDSSINIFDVRLVRRSSQESAAALPIQSFDGHVNALFPLGLAVDPSEDFLFAAGDDNLIRAWSFRTGRRLQPPPETDWGGLLTRKFSSPVRTMQITSEGHTNTLWVTSGTKLDRFQLGKRRLPEVISNSCL